MAGPEPVHCETCERTVARDEAVRRRTYGDLDPTRWQTLCCPGCGLRLKTVYVGGRWD